MGGFSGGGNRQFSPEAFQQFLGGSNPLAQMFQHFMGGEFGSKLGGWLNQLGQGGQGAGQQPAPATQPPSQPAYPGFQMPAYTWHRSMPQFTNLDGGGVSLPQGGGLPEYGAGTGGLLNLPGWQMQQAGQAGGTATGWKPTITSQNVNGSGGGSGQFNSDDPYRQLQAQGYAMVPGQGMVTMDPRMWSGPISKGYDPDTYKPQTFDARDDADWEMMQRIIY